MEINFGLCKKQLKHFKESYDSKAIYSIKSLNDDIKLQKTNGFKAFDMNKSVNDFKEYIEGFIQYKIENKENGLDNNVILERTNIFIETAIIEDKQFKFNESINFINNYLNKLNELNQFIESKIEYMNENDLSQDNIGILMKSFDKFLDKFEESMDNTMTELLHCSGYKHKKIEKKNDDFFLL